jgi:BirA family biotin operon repressor/biotin-[acetyl-CoA-carboxylase] ligase
MLTEIIRMFKEKEGFLSGEEMSRKLGITRSAIWKKIKMLREKGFEVEGSTAKGYRLIKSPEFSLEELRILVGGEIGNEIVYHETIDSTNTLAMKLAEDGSPHGTVVIADTQMKGKGRLGRTWVSPPKSNIYMSIIIRPDIEPKDATLLTIMAAIACADAIKDKTGLDVKIKWPNDLMVSEKKLGGILAEIKSDPDRIIFAVIGIGINVNVRLKDFPADVRVIATSVKEELSTIPSIPSHQGRGGMGDIFQRGRGVKKVPSPPAGEGEGEGDLTIPSRTIIITEILKELERWYQVLIRKGRKPLLDEWKRLSSTLGKKVKVVAGKDLFTGVAEDIDKEGMLMLRLSSGMLKKISAGDLTMLR